MSNTAARCRAYRIEVRRKKLKRNLRTAAYMAYPRAIYADYDLMYGKRVVVGKYLKHRKDSKAAVYCKRCSNRHLRRVKDLPTRGSGFHKYYDFWWTID